MRISKRPFSRPVKPSGGGGGGGSNTFTRVFFDDFESYSLGTMATTKWGQDGTRNMPQIVSSAIDGGAGPYSGTKMCRTNDDGSANVNGNDPWTFETATLDTDTMYTTELFIRFMFRIDADMMRSAGSCKKVMRHFYWDGNQATYIDLWHNVRNALCVEGTAWGHQLTVYWGGASGDNAGSTTGWHTIERYINQSTGQIKVWHDHALVLDQTNTPGARKWGPLYMTSNFSDLLDNYKSDTQNHLYFDNFEVFSDFHTGDLTTGILSDASIAVA